MRKIYCPVCDTSNPLLEGRIGAEKKSWLRHAGEWILWFLPAIGWLFFVDSMCTDFKRHISAKCQKCTHEWFLTKKQEDRLKNR